MKTAAAGAQAAFSEIERKRDKHTGNGGVLRLTRGKLTRHVEPDVDLTSGSGHQDDEGQLGAEDGFGRRGVRLSDGVDDRI